MPHVLLFQRLSGAGRPPTPLAVSTPPGVDAGPEPVPGLGPGARHDVVETTVPPAHYVSAYADKPGHDGKKARPMRLNLSAACCSFSRYGLLPPGREDGEQTMGLPRNK